MLLSETIFFLGLTALLSVYLYAKHRERMRSLREQDDSVEWPGKAIDVASLKPRLERVRRNYLAARQPVKGLCFHRALIDLARQAVARLPFFHDRMPEQHAEVPRG
jgi:hypothetical protein